MTKCLRYLTSLRCDCGAKGQLTWEEDDGPVGADGPINYEVVNITGPFSAGDPGKAVCILCQVSGEWVSDGRR